MTFAALQAMVRKMEIRHGNLADRLDDVLDRARVNADDTVYLEKAATEADYDRIALDTVASILAYTNDAKVCAWFKKQGIEW